MCMCLCYPCSLTYSTFFFCVCFDQGTQAIEGLVLNMHMLPAFSPSRNSNKVVLETSAFTRMPKLRFLQLSHVQLSGCYEEFPKRLRWLCWIKFPLASLPTDFPLGSLVALEMCYSGLRQLWRGKMVCHSTVYIFFSFCFFFKVLFNV
jgi:hypothetical protein